MINIERGTILRALFSCIALQTWFAGLYEPRSMHFLVTRDAGDFGYWVVGFMGTLGIALLLDTVVNDMLPKRLRLPYLLDNRPYVLMAMAILQAAELYVAAHIMGSWSLAFYCLTLSFFMTVTAFRDVQLRCLGNQKCET
jgi:hypothetical protein